MFTPLLHFTALSLFCLSVTHGSLIHREDITDALTLLDNDDCITTTITIPGLITTITIGLGLDIMSELTFSFPVTTLSACESSTSIMHTSDPATAEAVSSTESLIQSTTTETITVTVYPPADTGVSNQPTDGATAAAADPSSTATSEGQCDSAGVQCCDSVVPASSGDAKTLLERFDVKMDDTDMDTPIGISCDPFNFLGAGGNSCTSQPVCCQNNTFNGFIAIGCTPFNAGF